MRHLAYLIVLAVLCGCLVGRETRAAWEAPGISSIRRAPARSAMKR